GGSLRTGRCSTLNLLEISAGRPCHVRGAAAVGVSRRGQFIRSRRKIGGKVIHNRRRRGVRCEDPLRRLMNNFGNGTSTGMALVCPRTLQAHAGNGQPDGMAAPRGGHGRATESMVGSPTAPVPP